MSHPSVGTADYAKHVQEEIEHYTELFKEGEGRETLHQPIPPSWQECERRAWELVRERTGATLHEHVVKRLNARPDARFLSLGSGPGGMEIGFAFEAPRAKLVCMDINNDLMALGRQRATQHGLNMEFVEADLNLVELPAGSFDIVYCAASLHHLIELERLAAMIAKALRPGGKLITVDIVTPNGYLMWPETRRIVHSLWATLPAKFRVNHTADVKPRLDKSIWEADTSQYGMECARSGDILSVLEATFDVEEFVPYFSISRRFLDTMYGPNYDLDATLDKAIFDWIWALDRHYLDTGTLKPETFFGIYSPKRPKGS